MAFDPRRLPIIGEEIYQVGQIYDILAQPCGPSPAIVVDAFFTALPTLIWTIAKPDPFDLTTKRFGRHHKRITKRKFRLFDVTRGDIPLPKGRANVLLPINEAAQRIGWYFLIADATTDFLINWTSLAYVFSGCEDIDAPYASIKQPPGKVYAGSTPGTEQIAVMNDQQAHTWLTSPSAITAGTIGPKWVSGGFTQEPSGLAGGDATVTRSFIRKDIAGVFTDYDIGVTENSADRSTASGAQKLWNLGDPPAVFTLWAEHTAGHFSYSNAWMIGRGSTSTGIFPDP